MPGLIIRKVADKSEGERVVRFDPLTGEKKLVNPDTPGDDHESWPLAGIVLENEELPQEAILSTHLVSQGIHEGWIELEGEEMQFEPGGPPEDPYRVTHSFRKADTIILHCIDREVRYRVVHNPGRYPDGESMRVDWFYRLELDNG